MAIEITKSVLNTCGEFIGQMMSDSAVIDTKINNCDYTTCDLIDSELINYMVAGMFVVTGNLELSFQIIPRNNSLYVELKSKKRELDIEKINENLKESLKILRDVQLDEIKKEHEQIFKNEYFEYVRSLLYLYYFYGMKVIGSFMGINFDKRYDAKNVIDINTNKNVINESLENLRRFVCKVNDELKDAIRLKEKIDVTEVRIESLKIREAKLNYMSTIGDKTNKSIENVEKDEKDYLLKRINFYDTELIKFRNEMRIKEEDLNADLRMYLKDFLGVVDETEEVQDNREEN